MQILMLIEPLPSGGFRAKAGEPLNICAEGATEAEAGSRLVDLVNDLLSRGGKLDLITIHNGKALLGDRAIFPADEAYKTDWTFQALREEMAEQRRLDQIEEDRRLAEAENP